MYAFFSGTDAVNFVKQFDELRAQAVASSSPARASSPSPTCSPRRGASALGDHHRAFLHPAARQPANHKFVKDFREKYFGKMPDGFACQGYDTAEVIVRALKAVDGNTQDKDKLVDAIAKVEFDSPRGRFRFDPKTHNVIQPFIYVREVRRCTAASTTSPSTRSPTCGIRAPAARCPRRSGATAGAAGHAPSVRYSTHREHTPPRRPRAGRGLRDPAALDHRAARGGAARPSQTAARIPAAVPDG